MHLSLSSFVCPTQCIHTTTFSSSSSSHRQNRNAKHNDDDAAGPTPNGILLPRLLNLLRIWLYVHILRWRLGMGHLSCLRRVVRVPLDRRPTHQLRVNVRRIRESGAIFLIFRRTLHRAGNLVLHDAHTASLDCYGTAARGREGENVEESYQQK